MAISGSASAASRAVFGRLEVQPGEGADDLQVAQLLGADVHEQVLAGRVLAVEPLDRVLHGRGQLAVGPAELLQQHVAEPRVGLADADRVHELLDVVIHGRRLLVRVFRADRREAANRGPRPRQGGVGPGAAGGRGCRRAGGGTPPPAARPGAGDRQHRHGDARQDRIGDQHDPDRAASGSTPRADATRRRAGRGSTARPSRWRAEVVGHRPGRRVAVGPVLGQGLQADRLQGRGGSRR